MKSLKLLLTQCKWRTCFLTVFVTLFLCLRSARLAEHSYQDKKDLQESYKYALSEYSDYPPQHQIKKFKFDLYAKDPVCGLPEDREEYLELLSITRQYESTLLQMVPKGKELAQLVPVELFCAQMHQIFKCLLRNIPSSSSKDPLNLIFKTAAGKTWLVFKGSHAKVVAGYMTTPSHSYHVENDFHLISDKYNQNERKFLYVNKDENLNFDPNSEFFKFFRPRSTPMSNLRVFFHGNGIYSSGWLKDGVTVQVAIKGQIRNHSQRFEVFWNREKEYTLFLSSSEAWKTYQGYVNFVPGVFSLHSVSVSIIENNISGHFKGTTQHIHKSSKNQNLVSIKVDSNQIIPNLKNNKNQFSEFLIMEYSHGMKFNDFKKRLKSLAAVYHYNITDDWQGWFNNSLFLLYMGFSIISTFSTTGRYLYMHCDLHGENIIVQNIPSMTLSRILFTNMQKLVKLENIRIIDHMFVWTPKNIGDRNRSIPCTDLQEVSVTDTECLTALLLGPLFRWDYYPFETNPENTENFKMISKKSLDFFERIMNIPEWRRISSYYVGKAPEWYHQWKRFGSKSSDISINTFNEQFEGIMMVCDYLQNFMAENGVLQDSPCIQFHSYLRGYVMFSYRAMRVGYCVKQHISKILSNLKSFEIGTIPNLSISYWDLSRLSLLFYWNLLASNMETCLPVHNENQGFVFGFGGGIQAILKKEQCNVVKGCILEENQMFTAKLNKMKKVNDEIHGYSIYEQGPAKSMKSSYDNFMKHIRSQEFKNQKIISPNRDLQNLTLETISTLDGDLGKGISNKATNIIEAKKTFDYEEFLLDRWIFNLYYQSNLSLSLTLVGLRYSFRVESSFSGKKGQLNSIIKLLKTSALILNILPHETRDLSEDEILLSCDMFYKTYYEIAIQKYINNGENKESCKKVLEEITLDRNYKRFKSSQKFNKYVEEIKNSLFESNGQQKLNIINPEYICKYDFLNVDARASPNNEIIRQGFCNILIKPLKYINIKI
ncbi:uncharacterized protein ELE39_000563 [Cryptosporidium sp. chipmunk genotype I]|uniref:uncharacterized protein n=1 Tax=Cryptosporidium sp. chipmunk genotype I TaxID=1280935 RepID=UPI00351A02FD|nr:hypothetical protein ELE39_000563 [Cryptosporidium sp. chipmunk genotype I]